MHRRLAPLILLGLTTVLIFLIFHNTSWSSLPQAIGLGETYGPTDEEKANALPDLRVGRPDLTKSTKSWGKDPKIESTSPYPLGETKPAGGNYTRTLVMARTSGENVDWIDEELGDMLKPRGLLETAIYVVDDHSAPLHPPKNKGHEVMVYLSYIIDHYDTLPDISIFMHYHRYAWHNNDMMDNDAAYMVRHLSPERVTREGYMNLRCMWDPGCPAWLHPGATVRNVNKQEEELVAAAWSELFPQDMIPTVLAQPCCAQFAVSRARIRALPQERYISMRDWLLRTPLSDYLSGRVFEYIWQFIFTASAIACPSMSVCHCDGYGLCFGTPEAFDNWFEMRYEMANYEDELEIWKLKAQAIARALEDGPVDEDAVLDVPEVGVDRWLEQEIETHKNQLAAMKGEAAERGKSAKNRAIEAGREWRKGDGF